MNKNMLKQAQQLQARLAKAQEHLETLTVEGSSGGGAVKVIMTGQQTVQSVKIAPEATEDLEMLQDLVTTAIRDASEKARDLASQTMSAITGGMNLPDMF